MSGEDSTGLTRRVSTTVKRVFDESAPRPTRVRAGAEIVATAGTATGLVFGADHVVTASHFLSQLVDPAAVPVLVVAGVVNVVSAGAWITCPDRSDFGAPLGTFYRRVGVGAGLVTGTATVVAGAAEALNLDGIHGGGPAAVAAAATAAVAGTVWASGRAWGRIWAGPKPRPQLELGE